MTKPPDYRITETNPSPELAAITEHLLTQLPTWFGIPESNADYIAAATRLPGLVARTDTTPIGVLLHQQHFPQSAEIHLMAVAPTRHRQGIGAALINTLEAKLENTRLLQVKTLGPTHPDPGYANTRAFYRATGFLPLEETNAIWPGNPCLIMVKPLPKRSDAQP